MALVAEPAVSVVITAHNEGQWVRRTVAAVLEHSAGWPSEVIVVDDGSTDGSCAFLGEERWSGPVQSVRTGGLGAQRARNRGAAEARGETLVFLDAHVLPDPGWLEELVALLRDPSVGLAGLAVRSIDDPRSVGYTYTFVDEHLGGGWASPCSAEPYESPCVIGCCLGVRREVFEELGGFDVGGVRWGVEDVELGLRAWYLGYRCVVSPRAQVAHYFKDAATRNFAVSCEEYDVNVLRCVLTYFSGPRAAAILAALRRRESFERSLARVLGDAAFWDRRAALRRRFRRDEAWYFDRFAPELARFERRIEELRSDRSDAVETPGRGVVCPRCGATNAGNQTRCLLCRAELSVARQSEDVQSLPSRPAGSTYCPKCGGDLRAGTRFCTKCGHRLAA